MRLDPAADPYSRPSLLKRVAGPILRGMHAVLPAPAYNAIYQPAFRCYQQLLQGNYARRLAAAKRGSDRALVQKMERVFSVMPYSLISAPGLEYTHDLAQAAVTSRVAGSFVECGVAQGGCAALIAQVAAAEGAGRQCWFFDSFEGLPDPTERDYQDGKTGHHIRPLPKGSCLGTIEQVSELLFDQFGLRRTDIHLVKGWFQDTLPVTRKAVGPIALLRIDGDWYDSTMCVLEHLYEQVTPGGHVLVDDYCSCFGARQATDEFLDRIGLDVQLQPDGRGGASFQKPLAAQITRAA